MGMDDGKTIDVMGLGDLMIDFTYAGCNEEGIALYARNPAGSMANVLCQVARLGGKSVLVSTLGADEHSRYLYSVAESLGIDMSCVTYGTWPTRFMFAYCGEDNDRQFSDYRSPRNEAQTTLASVDLEKLKSSRFLDIKAILFDPDDPIIETQDRMLETAAENQVQVAIDLQWRGIPLPERSREILRERAGRCAVVKLTDEELAYYYDAADLRRGAENVLRRGQTQIAAVTMGRRGCYLRTKNAEAFCPTYAVPVSDTTGAGDSFMGALLYSLSRREKGISALDGGELMEIADFCNACASYSTMNAGSLLGMASRKDANLIRETYPKLPSRGLPAISEPRFIR